MSPSNVYSMLRKTASQIPICKSSFKERQMSHGSKLRPCKRTVRNPDPPKERKNKWECDVYIVNSPGPHIYIPWPSPLEGVYGWSLPGTLNRNHRTRCLPYIWFWLQVDQTVFGSSISVRVSIEWRDLRTKVNIKIGDPSGIKEWFV